MGQGQYLCSQLRGHPFVFNQCYVPWTPDVVGATVTGRGIPAHTRVTAFISPTVLVISQCPTRDDETLLTMTI